MQPRALDRTCGKEFSFAEKVLLADEFIERSRPHPRGQRFGLLEVVRFLLLEKRQKKTSTSAVRGGNGIGPVLIRWDPRVRVV